MNPPLFAGASREDNVVSQLIALHGPPAFVRRALNVEQAWSRALEAARKRRADWLTMPVLALGRLQALAGDWKALRPLLADDADCANLERLAADLQPQLRAPVAATPSRRVWSAALAEVVEALAVFNRRWRGYLDALDLSDVNQARQDYNRYYVLEKECVVRSPLIARQGFRPLPPATRGDVEALLPLLPVPRLADEI